MEISILYSGVPAGNDLLRKFAMPRRRLHSGIVDMAVLREVGTLPDVGAKGRHTVTSLVYVEVETAHCDRLG